MAGDLERQLREALVDFLKLFDIKMDVSRGSYEPEKIVDYPEMIAKTQEKLDELKTQENDVLKKSGMSKEDLEAYGSDPANFTPEQWKALQRVKEATENLKMQAQQLLAADELKPKEEKERAQEKPRGSRKSAGCLFNL